MTDRYICVHGHFYQPPRENPWLEAIELQDSAYPYHDWNERITAECYGPNATSRILDEAGQIVSIQNNYSRISFNFGPTLLSWMQVKTPAVYSAIIRADRNSRLLFSGHGSAMAQGYNHIILPLANARDKFTQVFWGIRDFEMRFGRLPEGMWLPETAVDMETLDILAERGILFTVLAPHQARRVRSLEGGGWEDVSGARIDPARPYLIRLPSGRSISVFFYDGPISRAVAFERLLNRGELFAGRLTGAFAPDRHGPQLVHIATDGETYGHHHRHGDMALAYALKYIEQNNLARLTNYGEFLEKHPPTQEVEIIEATSWSCAHGVERWKSNCGCNSGGKPGWGQEWRAPLRRALDWLRDELAARFETAMRDLVNDPWTARNDYIEVIMDRSIETARLFAANQAGRALSDEELSKLLKLLEIQRHALLMYTSCGWFFDDVSGIETVQVIQYAGRAIQLARDVFGDDLEPGFLDRLSEAKSNAPEFGDGRRIYERFVTPASMDLAKVGAHHAISSLFPDGGDGALPHAYSVERDEHRVFAAGKARLALGRMTVTSLITRETARFVYGILHLADHNISAGVKPALDDAAYRMMVDEVVRPFENADFPETIRRMDRQFGAMTYSLKSLFRDEQRRILSAILQSTLDDTDAVLRQIYDHHAPLMRFLGDLNVPLPKALHTAAEFVLNMALRHEFERSDLDMDRIQALIREVGKARIILDKEGLAYALQRSLRGQVARFRSNPSDLRLLAHMQEIAALVTSLPFDFDYSRGQNVYYGLLQTVYPKMREKAVEGSRDAKTWVAEFETLGRILNVRVDVKENM